MEEDQREDYRKLVGGIVGRKPKRGLKETSRRYIWEKTKERNKGN